MPSAFVLLLVMSVSLAGAPEDAADALPTRPNIILLMTDDQGWGQMGYYNHPHLETPELDHMAANGLRLDRFYAASPNCSPTRASILTGRSNERTGVLDHGHALRLQEKTLPQALKNLGYRTAHFGKWHLNGVHGPGAPILPGDPHHPGAYGYDQWLAATNWYDLKPAPLLTNQSGEFKTFEGDTSDVLVAQAINYIDETADEEAPFFITIWYPSPHVPFRALPEDRAPFAHLPEDMQNHLGELRAMDRSVGTLRRHLRAIGIADDTMLWFNSDNGGLKEFAPTSVGGLRGHKSTMWDGGLRVPAIIEWPGVIEGGRVSDDFTCTTDIFPTIADIVGAEPSALLQPVDGKSLKPLIEGKVLAPRSKAMPFRHRRSAALILDPYKIVSDNYASGGYQLYNLRDDPNETKDISDSKPEIKEDLLQRIHAMHKSLDNSIEGKDYPEGHLTEPDVKVRQWRNHPRYQPYLKEWKPHFPAYLRKVRE